MRRYITDVQTPAQSQAGTLKSEYDLSHLGFRNLNNVYWNLPPEALYEEIIFRSEGKIAHAGAMVVDTGKHTDLAVNDRFAVKEPSSEQHIWWGQYNRPFSIEKFGTVYQRLLGFLQGRDVFVRDCYAGADPGFRLPLRIITEHAWHSLFAHNMWMEPQVPDEYRRFIPEFTVISVPSFQAMPEIDGTSGAAFVLLNFDQRLCLIGNSGYSGEIKKSVFTVLNYLMPLQRVLPMRCSANVGRNGDVALFFGQSGTGKTTLAADAERRLVGDDALGWSDEGVFGFEDGCYPKVAGLSPAAQPQVWACTRRFGTTLENVTCDPSTRLVGFDHTARTANTRAAFPLSFMEDAVPERRAGHPKNIILLVCDASGVMPPIAKLTPEQAIYHFISGFTCDVGAAEPGQRKGPEVTFSACFGAPFMVHRPNVYAELLRGKILRHGVNCWLVNTGWSGGSFGVGQRMSIGHTQALLNAALEGKLLSVPYTRDPLFGYMVPESCEGVPSDILKPINTWEDKPAYQEKYLQLASLFTENFKKFKDGLSRDIVDSGPIRKTFVAG
jgi:phosphoenolpyruvate carboxykinase (ATP)